MDRWPVTTLTINLPNPAGGDNALVLGVQYNSVGSISSVSDNEGNTWVAGPSVVNPAYSQQMSLYYCLNAIAGSQNITVTFNGLQSTPAFPQAVVSEFCDVATAAALDGSAGRYHQYNSVRRFNLSMGIDFSDTNANGGAFNGTSITPGPGFTLLSADLPVGSADQYYVQPSAGAITPSFTTAGSAAWGSVALALKSAQAGTMPPPGIHIVHVQHTLLASQRAQDFSTPIAMQFPSSGNLLVGLYSSPDVNGFFRVR
jgi:hypothetical protein